MPKHSKPSRSTTTPAPTVRVNRLALALPFAITVGCAGPDGAIIDYTISEAEYIALTSPAPAAAEPVATALPAPAPETLLPETLLPETLLPATPSPVTPSVEQAVAAAIDSSQTELMSTLVSTEDKRKHALELPAHAEPLLAAATPAPEEKPFASVTATEISADALAKSRTTEQTVAELEAKVAMLEANQLEALTVAPNDLAEPKLAAAIDINKRGFTRSIYTTAGLGVSRANPDTSADATFSISDDIEPAGQVAVGVDLARFLSLEVHSADYGSTSLAPEGRINTHVNGVSALIYAGSDLDRFRRRGFNGYARVGFNQIEQTPVGNIPFLERTTNHVSFGLGAEYTTRLGLGLRADVVAYDGDIQYGQFGVLYRLARKPKALPKLAAAAPATDAQNNAPTLLPEVTENEPTMEKELPQVSFTTEQPESGDACIGLNGTLSNVNFNRGSAQLTHGATTALNNVSATLLGCSNRQIIVSAHTDNIGSALNNNILSKNRARAVAVHLANRGVDKNRVRAIAYGESRPIASNSTPQGRSRNRRVELEVR